MNSNDAETFIVLKYGKPNLSTDYILSLPVEVRDALNVKRWPFFKPSVIVEELIRYESMSNIKEYSERG